MSLSKFNFSSEALDTGLTQEEVEEFEDSVKRFQVQVDRIELTRVSAERLLHLQEQWFVVGKELFRVAARILSARATREATEKVPEKVKPTMLSRLIGAFGLFGKGK